MLPSTKKTRSGRKPEGLAALPAQSPRGALSDMGGKMPGDEVIDLYWESRIAAWLGVALKRVRSMRRRALREGEHWLVIEQEVVYNLKGVQTLRDHLKGLGVETADEKPKPTPEPAAEPLAPVGPPTRANGVVKRLYPNKRLMLCTIYAGKELREVTAMVRDNSNFMPGMTLELTSSPANGNWQYSGRMPRKRGKW